MRTHWHEAWRKPSLMRWGASLRLSYQMLKALSTISRPSTIHVCALRGRKVACLSPYCRARWSEVTTD